MTFHKHLNYLLRNANGFRKRINGFTPLLQAGIGLGGCWTILVPETISKNELEDSVL